MKLRFIADVSAPCLKSQSVSKVVSVLFKSLSRGLVALTVMAASAAQAGPVVASGSSYDAFVYGISSGLSLGTLVFDGVAQTYTEGGRTVTVNESEQDLGGGAHRISFVFTANADLYPTAGEGGFINIGGISNALDLLMAVDLVTSTIRMFDASGATVASGSTASPGLASWNGFFPRVGNASGFANLGAQNVRRVELDLQVAEIPEPQSLALVALALLAGAGFSRRKTAGA